MKTSELGSKKLRALNNIYVLVSGAKGSGKDSSVSKIVEAGYIGIHDRPVFKVAFSDVIKSNVIDYFGLPHDIDERKDDPCLLLNGKSFRDACIIYAESFMKPLQGVDILARITMNDIVDRGIRDSLVIITGVGFPEEIVYLSQRVPAANIMHYEVKRFGYTHQGDSRGRVYLPDSDNCSLANDTSMFTLTQRAYDLVLTFVSEHDIRTTSKY